MEQQPDDPSRVWLPELVQRFAIFLPSNAVPCSLRLVNKATAALFTDPHHKVIRFLQPVPVHAFTACWADRRTDQLRAMTHDQRVELLCRTARNGGVANLAALLAAHEYFPWFAEKTAKAIFAAAAGGGHLDTCAWLLQRGFVCGSVWDGSAMEAAAGAGHLHICKWLLENGCPWAGGDALGSAAEAGHLHICQWLLENGCPWDCDAPARAAKEGHAVILDWLLQQSQPTIASKLVLGAASGCDLATLQRMYARLSEVASLWQHRTTLLGSLVGAALSSQTVDWRAKAEWALSQGYGWGSCSGVGRISQRPDWRERVAWMLEWGFPLEGLLPIAVEVAASGDAAALEHLQGHGVPLEAVGAIYIGKVLYDALESGHLAIAEAVWSPAFRPILGYSQWAAELAKRGQIPAVEWLLRRFGAAMVLTPATLGAACASGSVELLAWLRERGCPWGANTFMEAMSAGCEVVLEWLAEHGCPMPDDGDAFVDACANGDLPMLRCLKRVGCTWRPEVDVFTRVLKIWVSSRKPCSLPALRWLLAQGCRVDWRVAEAAVQPERPDLAAVVTLLQAEYYGVLARPDAPPETCILSGGLSQLRM